MSCFCHDRIMNVAVVVVKPFHTVQKERHMASGRIIQNRNNRKFSISQKNTHSCFFDPAESHTHTFLALSQLQEIVTC